jgi:hypothetical protein
MLANRFIGPIFGNCNAVAIGQFRIAVRFDIDFFNAGSAVKCAFAGNCNLPEIGRIFKLRKLKAFFLDRQAAFEII